MATLQDEDKDVEFDPRAVSIIRQNWIDKQLKKRESEFTDWPTAHIWCGTYNVNAKMIADEDTAALQSWLYSDKERLADIFAVGFQEIVDLNAVNVAMDSKSMQRAQAWQEKLEKVLNRDVNGKERKDGERYVLVGEKHLVGILLVVFVKEMHFRNLTDVRGTVVPVGLMGMAGNKGGAAIRFKFYDSHLCFVCAHLAAHRENVDGRNADFASIMQKALFLDKAGQGEASAGNEANQEMRKYFSDALEVEPTLQSGLTIPDHDVVFWVGDLNYRFDETVSIEDCFEKIKVNDLTYLRTYDQLNMERARGRVFQPSVGWQEQILNFPPTYKYQPGFNVYEQRPEKKLRCPAWCDRILWRSKDPEKVQPLTYRRAELTLSDHKPVAALLRAKIRKIVGEKKQEVAAEIHRVLDRVENDQHPKVQLEVPGAAPGRPPNNIDLGSVRYGVETKGTILVTNIAPVAAQYRFVPKLEEETLCKPWLTIKPRFGMLLPGEVAEITFTAYIDNKTAQDLNSGQDMLDDILILRLEGGQDFFLSITGSYARSCFGMHLEELVNCYEPVRSLPLPTASWNPPAPLARRNSASGALSVPKELWRLVDFIYRHGLTEKDLFITPGVPSEVIAVREALDTGVELGPVSAHSVAEALLGLLSSLPEAVIPARLLPTMEVDAQNLRPWTRRFLEQLPPLNYSVVVYLISFFREVLKHHETNRLNTGKLAALCCNVLLPAGVRAAGSGALSDDQGGKEDSRVRSMQFIFEYFLTTSVI